MKIKAVCEATGLTDRAVRYYIDEGLIEPDYTENYHGRRNYDFSDEDVRALKRIAFLRKYDFTVAEIKQMLDDPESIKQVISGLKCRKKLQQKEDEDMLASLDKLTWDPQSVNELVAVLKMPKKQVPEENVDPGGRKEKITVWRVLQIIAYSLPILLAVVFLINALKTFRYIIFNALGVIMMCIGLIPSILGFVLPRFISNSTGRTISRLVLTGVCIHFLPFIVIAGSMLSRSETDNVENYLKMDNNCLAYRSDFFFDLFPSWSDFVRVQNEYKQYHYFDYEDFIGHRSDIFAQIKLGKEDFENEIAIQKSNFDRYFENHAEDWICLNYEEFTHGGYNCIAFYTDAEPFDDYYENWHIYMFAYNTESRTVRYAYYDCSEYDDSFNSELPYFASLSW